MRNEDWILKVGETELQLCKSDSHQQLPDIFFWGSDEMKLLIEETKSLTVKRILEGLVKAKNDVTANLSFSARKKEIK